MKSFKTHLKRIVSNVKLTFAEMTTILLPIEAVLNSRPLSLEDDGIDALTLGHFLIGHPLKSLPDPLFSCRPITLLSQWYLCQALVRHFWNRWYSEYIVSLRRYTKWKHPTRNARIGDIVLLQEDGMVPRKWPMAKVTDVHTGQDGLVRVVTVKTAQGSY